MRKYLKEIHLSLLERDSFYFYKFIKKWVDSGGKQRAGCLFGKLGANLGDAAGYAKK